MANIDADFIAYQVACETRDELDGLKPRRTLEEMKKQVLSMAQYQMKQVGATRYVLYTTPAGSSKGGRPEQAVTRPYQGNRVGDKPKPEHLDTIRHYMGEECQGVVSLYQEADDALAQANYTALKNGTPELSVLVSKDKDLNMVPGYYYDFTFNEVRNLDEPFGYIEKYYPPKKPGAKNKPAAKIIGRGTKFFWWQCLAGDTADNIAGLPTFYRSTSPRSAAPSKCGAVAAFVLLQHAKTDRECYDIVRAAYEGSPHEWVHWATQKPVTWGEALYGDMQTLWMRRYPDDTVADFLKETLAAPEDENYVPWLIE